VCLCACVHAYVHMCACVCVCARVSMHRHMAHVYVHVCIHFVSTHRCMFTHAFHTHLLEACVPVCTHLHVYEGVNRHERVWVWRAEHSLYREPSAESRSGSGVEEGQPPNTHQVFVSCNVTCVR
jgi:hypothetical protein